jgi:hypothetical protein
VPPALRAVFVVMNAPMEPLAALLSPRALPVKVMPPLAIVV